VSPSCIGWERRDRQQCRAQAGRGKSGSACHIEPLLSLTRGSMIAPAKAKSWHSPDPDVDSRRAERFAAALILRNVAVGRRF
jgi:hypothetical protein